MSKPTHDLFRDGLRVLSYLHRTRNIGLVRYQADTKHLNGQSDSDWGARTSFYLRMAVLLLPASSPAAGVPRNRVSVTLFSCEAKIMAASEAAKEAEFRVYSSLQQQTD